MLKPKDKVRFICINGCSSEGFVYDIEKFPSGFTNVVVIEQRDMGHFPHPHAISIKNTRLISRTLQKKRR